MKSQKEYVVDVYHFNSDYKFELRITFRQIKEAKKAFYGFAKTGAKLKGYFEVLLSIKKGKEHIIIKEYKNDLFEHYKTIKQ